MISPFPQNATLRRASSYAWFSGLLLGGLLIGAYFWSGGLWDGRLRILAWLMLLSALTLSRAELRHTLGVAALAYGVWSAVGIIHTNFTVPHEWDFLCVYLDARTLALGLDPYQPAGYAAALPQLEMPLAPSAVFGAEILEVGFKYLPPSMLLYAPLGWLSYEEAHLLWVLLNWAAAGYAGYLLYRMSGWGKQAQVGPVLLAALCLLWPASKPAIHFENSHGLMWLVVMLLWRDRHHPRAALWLALGPMLKPFYLLMFGYFVLRGRWRTVGLGLLGMALTWGLAWLSFGPEPIHSFFFDNPNQRVPDFQFTTLVNHSLLSNLVRWTAFDFGQGHSPLEMPLFWGIGGTMGLLSVGLAVWLPQQHEEWAMALLLAVAVIVYPGSLKPYSLLLLSVFLLLWRDALPQVGPYQLLGALALGLSMGLMVRYAFWANVILWVSVVVAAWANGHKLRIRSDRPVAFLKFSDKNST